MMSSNLSKSRIMLEKYQAMEAMCMPSNLKISMVILSVKLLLMLLTAILLRDKILKQRTNSQAHTLVTSFLQAKDYNVLLLILLVSQILKSQ